MITVRFQEYCILLIFTVNKTYKIIFSFTTVVINIQNSSYAFLERNQLEQVCIELVAGFGQLLSPVSVVFSSFQHNSSATGE